MSLRRAALPLLLSLFACVNPETLSGSYEGKIVDADFLRQGFAPGVTLTLDLQVESARRATGTLSTSDGTFVNAPLAPLGSAPVDLLGEADLPGSNPIVLFLSAPTVRGEEALLVLSLGGEGGDDLRIAYGREGLPNTLYGIFPLARASE